MEKKFSHLDISGKANMVDVGDKKIQLRQASASGSIILSRHVIEQIKDNLVKKGDVLTIAEIAGIQSAKQTSSLIPLCHPLNLTKIDVKASLTDSGVEVCSLVRCIGQTGVEMEALIAVSVALLTIYDMCKAIDKNMIISDIKLTAKIKTDINSK